MSRIVRLVMPLVAAVGVAVFIAPSSASAAPVNCSTGWITAQYNTPVGAWSGCTHGSGSHRVVVKCQASPYTYYLYGPWRPAGQQSIAYCGAGHLAVQKGYQTTG